MARISNSTIYAIKAEYDTVLRSEGPRNPLYGITNKVFPDALKSKTVITNVEDQLLHSDDVVDSTCRFTNRQVNESIKP